MKASDFRIGNLINYKIVDNLDSRKEWFEVSEIDHDDLRVLVIKHKMNQDYQSIILTEEWLLKFGFKETKEDKKIKWFVKNRLEIVIGEVNFIVYDHLVLKHIKYIHQLQNLHFALTGKELKIK
jgi:hypothetical protein